MKGTAGYIGVDEEVVYHAYIFINGEKHYLNTYSTAYGAAKAHDKADIEMYEEAAVTNKEMGFFEDL